MITPRPLPKRKRLRLREYDYSTPAQYFVTICIVDRRSLLGRIVGLEVELSAMGRVVEDVWIELPQFYPSIELDAFVVMPNHFHGIIGLRNLPPTPELPRPKRPSLSEAIRSFKSMSARAINRIVGARAFAWQRGFYEHIVRDERDLARIRDYIERNPIEWANDPENPERVRRYRR